jgi:tetratricopeptide (TPR) repeat protein
MRGRSVLLVLSAWVAVAAPARAGHYRVNAAPLTPTEIPSFKDLRLLLSELSACPDRKQPPGQQQPRKGSLREKYVAEAAALEARRKDGTLSVTDAVNLASYDIALGRLTRAQALLERVLEGLPADHPARFLVLLNLAAAYGGDVQPDRPARHLETAVDYQKQALKAWPTSWAGWGREHLAWYRRCERLQLALWEARLNEAEAGKPAPPGLYVAQDLFPGLRFVGPGGAYEPGALAVEMWDTMPPDAVLLVLQLVLWWPDDTQLYWLYGELQGVNGQIEEALTVFDELVNARALQAPELRAHREAFKAVAGLMRQLRGSPLTRAVVLWSVTPPAPLLPPVAGPLCNAVPHVIAYARAAAEEEALKAGPAVGPQETGQTPGDQPPSVVSPLPDWKMVTVGFVAGVVVATLAGLQWREWRRRAALPAPAVAAGQHVPDGAPAVQEASTGVRAPD